MERISRWMAGETASGILELFSVLCMFYAALGLTGMYAASAEGFPLMLVFCLIFGGIRTAGRAMGQQRGSVVMLAAVFVLLSGIFRPQGHGVEVAAALAGYCLLAGIHAADRPRRIYTLCAGLLLFAGFLMGKPVSRLLSCVILLLLLKEVVSLYGRRCGLHMLPFLLLLPCMTLFFPAKEEPIDWSFIIRFGNNVAAVCREMVTEAGYLMEEAGMLPKRNGYGSMGEPGGGLWGNSREELYVYSDDVRGRLYLTGTEYATLEDNRWRKSTEAPPPFGAWYALYINALYQNDVTAEEAACFSKICAADITYGYLKTEDVIHPQKPLRPNSALLGDMTEQTGAFTFRKREGKGYQYRMEFMDFDYASPYLDRVLRESGDHAGQWASYDELDAYSRELYGIRLPDIFSREAFGKWNARLQEPEEEMLSTEGMTDRMRDLALRITRGCDSDYEKCLATEAYLRQYTYSAAADLREYENFTDAFLFERQEGYCFHFASAMVMLLRANGIPARMAEGYRVGYGSGRTENSFRIRGDDAHAWPEAWIAGYGWVGFEPTAGVYTASSYAWNLRVKEEPEETSRDRTMPPVVRMAETMPGPLSEAETEKEDEEQRLRRTLLWLLPAVLPVSVLCLFLSGLAVKRLRYRRKRGREKLEADLADIRWLIRALCGGDWTNRPLLLYARILRKDYPDAPYGEEMEQAVLAYYRLRYKGDGLTAGEEETVRLLAAQLYREYMTAAGKAAWRYRIQAWIRMEGRPEPGGVYRPQN